ncbi:MAG: ATPase [Myxococcaceae bacterium]|nr:MAG: ATPase [Myxococcaceae bacterium]
MLKELKLINWKSFQETSLFIDPLTVIIGLNASGKSNALDALEFLRRTGLGLDFSAALGGDARFAPMRGGAEWAPRIGTKSFTVECLVEGLPDEADYYYKLTVDMTGSRPELFFESLRARWHKPTPGTPPESKLFEFAVLPGTTIASASTYPQVNARPISVRNFHRSSSLLSQLNLTGIDSDFIKMGVQKVSAAFRDIFILDPSPGRMRAYVPFAETLLSDGSNTAGVLAALDERESAQVERSFEQYLSRFAERDLMEVWAEPVGKFKQDAMLYCREQWIPEQPPMEIDARGMSDGTLRFVAIITALMTRPRGSLLVIEEVDNGLHPSRARLMLEMLKSVATERGIDVLVTTHNVALLDALGPDMLPFVQAAHRDPKTGGTLLTPIQDLSDLPKLLAVAPLGRLASQGLLEQSLIRDAEEPTS